MRSPTAVALGPLVPRVADVTAVPTSAVSAESSGADNATNGPLKCDFSPYPVRPPPWSDAHWEFTQARKSRAAS
jgi:hypothetical protein